MNEQATIMMVIVFNTIFIVFLIKMFSDWIKLRYKNKIYGQMMQKINSPKDLSDFLNSTGGEDFLKNFQISELSPHQKIIATWMKGIIISFLGIALIIVGAFYDFYPKECTILGILGTATGIGFIVSALLTHHLSKKWDLVE